MKAPVSDSWLKNDLTKHPHATDFMPKRPRYREMSRFNDKLKDCVDPEGDFFAVPINGPDVGIRMKRTYVTIWQVGEKPGTAEMRHVLYDYKTMEPIEDLTRERLEEILSYFVSIVGPEQYEKMQNRLEAEWKKWRKEKESSETHELAGELKDVNKVVGKGRKSVNLRAKKTSEPQEEAAYSDVGTGKLFGTTTD
jgi:hypothetical protein